MNVSSNIKPAPTFLIADNGDKKGQKAINIDNIKEIAYLNQSGSSMDIQIKDKTGQNSIIKDINMTPKEISEKIGNVIDLKA